MPKFKIAVNTFVQVIGKLIGAAASLLITILIARSFGVEGYGEFTKIIAFVTPLYLVADFGFNAIVLKKISENEDKTVIYFSNLLGLRLLISLILIFLAVSVLSLLPYNPILNQGFSPQVKLGIIFLSLTILTQSIFTTANVLFQKNLRYDLSVISALSGSLIIVLSVFAFTSLRAPLLLVITSYIIGGLVMATSALNFSRRFLPQFKLSFNFSVWKKLFWETLPISATLIFNLIYFRADMIILSFMRANTEVSYYGLAYKFFEVPLAIATFFMNSLYPVLLHSSKENKNFSVLIKKISIFLFIVSLVITIIYFIGAPYLGLIRSEFIPAVPALRILSLSFPLFFLSAFFMWVLIAIEKQNLLAIFYGTSMVLNILLNFIFIPRYGYLAAAVITNISELWILVLLGVSLSSFLKKSKTS